MNRLVSKSLLALCAFAFVVSAQMSYKWKGTDGWGINTPYEQLISHFGVQSFSGTIMQIDTLTPIKGMSVGIQFLVKSSSGEEIPVQLGPQWFLVRQDLNLTIKSAVEIRGTRFSLNGKNTVAAFTVIAGDRALFLRDSEGIPYWCAWRNSNGKL